MSVPYRLVLALAVVVALSGCSWFGYDPAELVRPDPSGDALYPDVIAAELRPAGVRTFDVVVTIASAYDSPQRYADGWRVLGPDGEVLGTHTLLHDHASEQPFTRTQPDVHIPDGITSVTIEGRDLANGFGGETLTVAVPA